VCRQQKSLLFLLWPEKDNEKYQDEQTERVSQEENYVRVFIMLHRIDVGNPYIRYLCPMNLDPEILALARKVWDYHHVNHPLQKADCILALGSHDTRVAERGAELMLQGYAPLIIFSGGLGRLTEGLWTEPEADTFANVARQMGVPEDKILTENRSTNTGENIALSCQLLQKHGVEVERLILVQKPYMERRALATFEKQWPGEQVEIMVTSPQIPFEEYPNEEISLEHVIHIMIGDLQRIRLYPRLGFQTYQEIPADVWEAYERLVEKGFTSHLMAEA
jgi:uncharacterized SAM-binding protein YcdF (DUF218 family)